MNSSNKKILFLTSTRADFGKMKPLIDKIESDNKFENFVFVTGMHTLSKFGSTYNEVKKQCYSNMFVFINQSNNSNQDTILSNTITGFSNFVKEVNPDLIVVHGDRIEALAGSIVGSINNILVAHIEGGEISGHIDEIMRHAITKMSHIHFVANRYAKKRLIQMGESKNNIFVIGSPDIEVMNSNKLPNLHKTKKYYGIDFNQFSILIFHPVSNELIFLDEHIKTIISALKKSQKKFIVIFPNNDDGCEIIMKEYVHISNDPNFKIFPSIRFQNFLTLLKHCEFIIGNSSAGVRESEVYGIPSINIGSRQKNRNLNKNIINIKPDEHEILNAIKLIKKTKFRKKQYFNPIRNSSMTFHKILKTKKLWNISTQKQFVDL